MAHKVIFFNCNKWGEEAKSYLSGSEKLKTVGVEVVFIDTILSKDNIPTGETAHFDIAGVFMDSPVDADVIAALPELKFIATGSTGYDHIDLAAAAARGIPVSSVPTYGENTVAEFAFALILALSRKMIEAELGFTYLSLEDLLKQSDIITVHAPYLPSTHHLINMGNVHLIKKGALLVNTARGAIVETAALVAALKDGTLASVGVDVLEEEAMMKEGDMHIDAELIGMPNVIVTPHNAFNTHEAFLRILDTTIDNIVAFVNGAPINAVKPPADAPALTVK